jgi:hypothetical protein
MKSDLNDLKKLTMELMESGNYQKVQEEHEGLIDKIYGNGDSNEDIEDIKEENLEVLQIAQKSRDREREREREKEMEDKYYFAEEIEEEETLSLQDKELELIKKSLERHNGKRKMLQKNLE